MKRLKNNFIKIILLALICTNLFAGDYPIVPAVHPRVFITPIDIAVLQNKKDDPEFQDLWNDIEYLSKSHFLSAALIYLIEADIIKGRWAVENALTALKNKPSESVAINKSSNIMNRAACVYDWCYALLTTDEKSMFITEFERLAATEAPGYPADYSPYSVIVGHIAESNLQLSQLIAGCAIYDESQVMWDAALKLNWDKFIPARNKLYKMHMYWQGDSYIGRFINDSYNAWFYRKLGAGDVYVSDMQYIPYGMIYSTRPDGRQFKRGDRYDEKGNAGKKGPLCRTMAMYWENPYLATIGDNDWYAYYASSNDGSHDMEKVFEFVFRPSNLNGSPLTDLPLTKYFPDPMGEMIVRTGWDWLNEESNNAVISIEMGGCDFKGHTNPGHFGGFQIYYKGALAISTGSYQNKTAHDNNYHEKSQSHNVMLILDPDENTSYGSDGTYTARDGGQICQPPSGTYETKPVDYEDLLERFRKVNITGYEFGPDSKEPEYSYICGDLTPAYSNRPVSKVSEVKRSMVALNNFNSKYPATLIVYDWLVSTNAAFKKTWQIHSIEEPTINGKIITIKRTDRHYTNGPSDGRGNYSGKLEVQSLLPENSEIKKIGGEGFDCWVEYENKNYPPSPQLPNYDRENGMWRVEVSPSEDRIDNNFLNVMTVMDDTTTSGPTVELIETDEIIGVKILERIVCFSKTGVELGGDLSLNISSLGQVKVLVCNLEAGLWNIIQDGNPVAEAESSPEGKSIYFTAEQGNYILSKMPTSIELIGSKLNGFELFQNYPNPFNPSTVIKYSIPYVKKDYGSSKLVTLKVYDILGREVESLINKTQNPGNYSFQFNAKNLPSGVYYYRLKCGGYVKTKKMVLIR